MKQERIPVIAREQKKVYTWFFIILIVLFAAATYFTKFNPMSLVANGDAFWTFLTEDFLPPALPADDKIPGILSSVVVTLALAISSTAIAAILAFFVSLFGSEKSLLFQNLPRSSVGLPPFSAISRRWFGLLYYFLRWELVPVWGLLHSVLPALLLWYGPLWKRWKTFPKTVSKA